MDYVTILGIMRVFWQGVGDEIRKDTISNI